MRKRSAAGELFLGNMGSIQRETRPSIQREDQPTMETKLEQIAASAVNHLSKSVVRQIRTLRSVGAGGGRPPPATRWAGGNLLTYPAALDPANLSTKRQWIADLARTKRGTALCSLHHVIDLEWMLEAYDLTRKDSAPGIDGVTAMDYEANLEANLLDLLERIKSGRYEAPPVRRVYISKVDGSQRPLGIPTFEDKVAQRAMSMVLEAIYEQDYLPCSYGFRPGRSAHQALNSLQREIWSKRLYWVLELDIRKYFDSIPHTHLRAFLDQRVKDGVIRRMIDKWLNAGVVEDSLLRRTTEGTPQGG